jgi:hypothetical protein
MTGGYYMDEEKKQLQEKHRKQEAELRNKLHERKTRTRRLIEHGAILESVYPEAASMDGEVLKAALQFLFNRL